MRRSSLPRLSLAVLLFAGLPTAALAGEQGAGFHPPGAQWMPVRHVAMTVEQEIEMAERRFHARVVRAGIEESAGQRTYVLRLVNEQGRVWTVRVAAQSGQVL